MILENSCDIKQNWNNINIDAITITNTATILGVCKFKLPTQNLNLSDIPQSVSSGKFAKLTNALNIIKPHGIIQEEKL